MSVAFVYAAAGATATPNASAGHRAAADAAVTVSPTVWSAPGRGGTHIVTVVASDPTEAWTVASAQPWLTVSPASGTGSGSVTLTAGANPSEVTSRNATVTVGGQAVTVTQSAASVRIGATEWAAAAAGSTTNVAVYRSSQAVA